MTYNANKPKNANFLEKIDIEQDKILPYFRFYGTDSENNRTTYLDSISNEIRNSIFKPTQATYSSFFRPFPNTRTAAKLSIVNGFRIILAVFAPYLLIAEICLSSAFELITAFISLCKGIYETTKGDHPAAAEYYLDATTRAALILPLLVLNTVKIPLDVIFFFTQSIASLIEYARGVEPSPSPANEYDTNLGSRSAAAV